MRDDCGNNMERSGMTGYFRGGGGGEGGEDIDESGFSQNYKATL